MLRPLHTVFASVTMAAALSALALPGASPAAASTFDCVIEASLTVKVGSPVASIVTDVTVDRGDYVKKGQILAHIESSAEQSAVEYNKVRAESTAEVEAKLAVLEQKAGVLHRKTILQEQRVGSVQDVENAQADFGVAKQELALAQLNHRMAEIEFDRAQSALALRTIRSPIDGVVMQRSIGPGEFFHPDATIVTIAQIDPLYVEAYLPVSLYKLIKVGDVATVHPSEPIGGERQGKVTVVDQVLDAASGTFSVRLELPNADRSLAAGLRCHVTFDTPEAGEVLAKTTP
jgi:RND family efflux transporter MFP subunit